MPLFSMYIIPHSKKAIFNGMMVCPSSESRYSTFSGISGYTCRSIIPSFSSSRSCWLSILCVTPDTRRCNSLYRRAEPISCFRMSGFHFPPITSNTISPGQRYGPVFTSDTIELIDNILADPLTKRLEGILFVRISLRR